MSNLAMISSHQHSVHSKIFWFVGNFASLMDSLSTNET